MQIYLIHRIDVNKFANVKIILTLSASVDLSNNAIWIKYFDAPLLIFRQLITAVTFKTFSGS